MTLPNHLFPAAKQTLTTRIISREKSLPIPLCSECSDPVFLSPLGRLWWAAGRQPLCRRCDPRLPDYRKFYYEGRYETGIYPDDIVVKE